MGDAASLPFPKQYSRVKEWLDNIVGSERAKRDANMRPQHGTGWRIDLGDPTQEIQDVRLVLPSDFPASPCRLYVDLKHFLRVPHIEADGHVCLGLTSIPADYDDPIAAVVRALGVFQGQILPIRTLDWVQAEFQAERESYWAHMCQNSQSSRRPVSARTLVDVGTLARWKTGALAAYIPARLTHRHVREQVAAADDIDADRLAARHGWARGMMVRGNALFVRLPDQHRWTPATWPKTFRDLDALVAEATAHEISLSTWLTETGWYDDPKTKPKKRRRWRGGKRPPMAPQGQRPLLVTLVLGTSAFGYQVLAPMVPGLTDPHIEPLEITRIDPDWALARDQQRTTLHARRSKRILVLGCGSLGSPLVVLLARAGVGHLDLVDSETMGTENTARHELGIDDADQGKGIALAARLKKQIPGLSVRGFRATVTRWCPQNCRPGDYDLVIECTGESSVRTYLSHKRQQLFGDCPVIHAWVEPLCSAGHVVLAQISLPWPADDPADSLVNASNLSASDTRIHLPGCAAGFHPYGAADVAQVAAFAAERIISVLDSPPSMSQVWSWVRSRAFFSSLRVPVTLRSIVPHSDSSADSATITRNLATVLQGP